MEKRKKVLVDADWFKLTNYKAWEQPEFAGIVEVTTTDTYTVIFSHYTDVALIEKMYIDGVLIDEPVKQYTFDTLGEHTIKCVFAKDSNLEIVNGSIVDGSNFKKVLTFKYDALKYMFYNGSNIESIDLSNIINNPKNKSISQMFYGCRKLTNIDLSPLDIYNITSMSFMFNTCVNLQKVKMMGDVSKVEDVYYMFGDVNHKAGANVENPKFYYDARYDYSKIIAELPENWTAIPVKE